MGRLIGAEIFVRCLEDLGVEYIFCVPGASIDPILNVLRKHGPKLIVCRHEQNAALMAEAWGNITGNPGVCLVTSGPGLTNIVTGVATAFSERRPLVAFTGQICRRLKFKHSHQNIASVEMFRSITKWSVEADYLDTLPDIIYNGFQIAMSPRPGPVHVSLLPDILQEEGEVVSMRYKPVSSWGTAAREALEEGKELIKKATRPVIFLGRTASQRRYNKAICRLIRKLHIPTVATFEAAGCVSEDLVHLFLGRLGVFKNQPGDIVVDQADLVITIGFDPVEYDPAIWNKDPKRPLLNIDLTSAILDQKFQPQVEILGDIALNLDSLIGKLEGLSPFVMPEEVRSMQEKIVSQMEAGGEYVGSPVPPLRIIYEMRYFLGRDITVISDVGSHQYWWARNFFCFHPKCFLTSMGFQTMGVSIPWAIAASLAKPNETIFSISGDGSFLMCSMELETIKRLKLPIIHMVWEDGSYNLVKIQQEIKYGHSFGTDFGFIDIVAYAKSFGLDAYRIEHTDQIKEVLQAAFSKKEPAVISVPIDYSLNEKIVKILEGTC